VFCYEGKKGIAKKQLIKKPPVGCKKNEKIGLPLLLTLHGWYSRLKKIEKLWAALFFPARAGTEF
jgi:hypothetical protein